MMQQCQFGRIENMSVCDGQPILSPDVKVVRVVRLGGRSGKVKGPSTDEFELKRAVCDLLDELERLQNGMVVLLEFKHGLPFLLETTPHCSAPVR
jgi:hypothetical protein